MVLLFRYLFLSSIHGLVPSLMFLLKFICITLFKATLTALFTGLVLVTTGGVVVVNLVVYGAASPTVPVVSVTAFECIITMYLVPFVSGVVGVMLRMLPVIVVVKGFAVPVLDVTSSIHGFVPN